MPPVDPRGEEGFSLLETLISFAVLALVLSGVFGAGMMSLRGSDLAAKRTEALLEARSLIDRLGADIALVPGRYDGTSDAGFAYRLAIDPVEGGARLSAYAITAELRARASDKAPLVSLRTLRVAETSP